MSIIYSEKKEKKEFSRSIRMTKTVYDFVEKQDGNGFNEKFENMVLRYMNEEKRLNENIKSKKNTLSDIEKRIEEKREILNTLNSIEWRINQIFNELN